jgi:hypothetical protein
VDPVDFEWESPYGTFHNNPIYFSDWNGATPGNPDCKDCDNDKTVELGQVVVTAKAPEALKQRNAQEVQSLKPPQLSASMLGSLSKPSIAAAKKLGTKIKAWWKSHEFYAKTSGEVTLGAQVGVVGMINIPQVPGLRVAGAAKANLGSITLGKAEYDTHQGGKGTYAWQNGSVHVTQELAIGGGLKYGLSGTTGGNTQIPLENIDILAIQGYWKHEFDGYDGYFDKEQTEYGATFTTIAQEFYDPDNKVVSKDKQRRTAARAGTLKATGVQVKVRPNNLSVGTSLEAAAGIGIKLQIEIGVRTKM